MLEQLFTLAGTVSALLGFALMVSTGFLGMICLIAALSYFLVNRAYTDFNRVHGFMGLQIVLKFYKKHHNGKLPASIEKMK
jgi:hypothetical protein